MNGFMKATHGQGPGKVAIRPVYPMTPHRGPAPRDCVGPGREPDSSDRHGRTYGADRDFAGALTHGVCANCSDGGGANCHTPGPGGPGVKVIGALRPSLARKAMMSLAAAWPTATPSASPWSGSAARAASYWAFSGSNSVAGWSLK